MADIAVARDRGEDPIVEHTGFRLSWGAVFAGLVVATGLHLVLALLGAAIGLSAWDPAQVGGVQGDEMAAGIGIWAVVSGLIALVIGGMTTGRLAGVLTRGDGALHGVILWALTTLMIVWLVLSGARFLVGGAFGIIGQTAGAAVSAVGGVAPEIAGPALTGAVRGEERETLVTQITQRTGLTRAEAEQIVADSERQAQQTRQQAQQQLDTLQARAPQIAQDVSDTAARGAWWALLALGLSFGAATLGAASTARE